MRYQRYSDGKVIDGYPHAFGPRDFLALARFLRETGTVPVRGAVVDHWVRQPEIVLRHDVDHNLEHAVEFARWEARQGFSATYYVLPTAWYWADAQTPSLLRELASLGHEVGVHQDTVAEAARQGYREPVDGSALPAGNCDRAAEILTAQVEEVRSMGVPVYGTSTHGTPLWKTDGITNCFLWAAGYSADDFGLEYADSYHLHRRALYISDNRGGWSSPLRRDLGRQTHLLIHPAHWNVDELSTVA